MKQPWMRGFFMLALSALALGLTACASPASRTAMTPQNMVLSKHHPYTLAVRTAGGAETGAMDSSNVSDSDLKAAIEDAVIQSKLFTGLVQGSAGDYELTVRITSLSKPLFGGSFTVEMESAWSLIKISDKTVAMRKSVKSSGTATMGDAFAAVTRLRLALENATRENISQGLQAIAGLNL